MQPSNSSFPADPTAISPNHTVTMDNATARKNMRLYTYRFVDIETRLFRSHPDQSAPCTASHSVPPCCALFFGSAASMRKAITDNRRHVNRNIAWTFQQHCKLERS